MKCLGKLALCEKVIGNCLLYGISIRLIDPIKARISTWINEFL